MFFNEDEATVTDEVQLDSNTSIDSVDLELDAPGDSPAAANAASESGEVVDLSFSRIQGAKQTDQTDTVHEGACCSDCKDVKKEEVDLDHDELAKNGFRPHDAAFISKSVVDFSDDGIDLDFDVIEDGNQTDATDSYHKSATDLTSEADSIAIGDSNDETNQPTELGLEADDLELDVMDEEVGLDFNDIKGNNQTDQTDSVRDEEKAKLESVTPITFSEKSVRVFARKGGNLIMESDLHAVEAFYNYQLSESECVEMIANAHNISEDSIAVVISEESEVVDNKKINKVKKATSPIDNQIKALLDKKKKLTPEQWKKMGLDDKLKQLRARKTLNH